MGGVIQKVLAFIVINWKPIANMVLNIYSTYKQRRMAKKNSRKDGKYGIDSSKKLVTFVVKLGITLVDVFQDGKLTLNEIPKLGGALLPSLGLIGESKMIGLELRELSKEETEEIVIHLQKELKISDGKAQTITHYAIEILKNSIFIYNTVNKR